MSDISKRLMGPLAVVSRNGKVSDVDLAGLVRKLLLFDKFVLNSVRLQEFPLLVRHIGFEGLRDLLAADLLEIRCECLQIAQVGQSGIFGDRILPPYYYKFNWVDAHDREKYIDDGLGALRELESLTTKEAEVLEEAIKRAIRPLPKGFRQTLFPAFLGELSHRDLLNDAVRMAVRRKVGELDFSVDVTLERVAEDTFRIGNDIAAFAGITTGDAHRIVESGILGVAGLSQALKEMEAFESLSGFTDEDLPLFRKKLGYVAAIASTEMREKSFQRVLEVSGLPEYGPDSGALSIEKLLDVRESSEARQFRDWLASCGGAEEEEIRDRVAGLRAKAGVQVGSAAGKTVRFLMTSLIGLVPNPIVGLVAGSIDQFVVDRILPRSGVAAFVNELYPSIFERQ